jgi:hypothetical protein
MWRLTPWHRGQYSAKHKMGGTVMLERSLMVFLIAVSPVNAQAA